MSNKFIRQLIKEIQDEATSVAEDATSSAEYTGFIDTGSYIFNGQLSGSLYGGMPNTKCLMLAGLESVGKTFFALSLVKNFLDKDSDAFVFWYLAEPAVTKKMLVDRGIDPNRVIFAEPVTVFQWRHHVIKTLDAYMEQEDRPPMMMVLDSLGSLSTEKELDDSTKGIDKRDMTKQQHVRGTFRLIDKKLARAKVPMIVTNHTYAIIGSYVPMQEISGGGGVKYASDLTAILSASKERDEEKEVTGNIIRIKMHKNRIAKQHTVSEVLLSYDTGLNRYYGLLELAVKYDIVKRTTPEKKEKKEKEGEEKKKVKGKFEFPNGEKAFEKAINKNPEKYFTSDMMALLEEAAHQEFCYGKGGETIDNNEDDLTTIAAQ